MEVKLMKKEGSFMNAETFLKNEIEYKTRQRLIGAFSRAYAGTENLKYMDSSFDCQKGKEALVAVRNLKVETQIRDEANGGFLPFECKEEKNCAENCTHYEFLTENAVITVSRVLEKYQLPRKAKYRENLSFNNQISLFEQNTTDEKKHILMTHTGKDGILESLVIGIPAADGKSWEYCMNLLEEPVIMQNTEEKLPENIYKVRENIKKEVK